MLKQKGTNKMDKEKAEGLVKSLLDTVYAIVHLAILDEGISPHYLETVKKRNELKDEIIRYLIGEKEEEKA